MSKPLGLLKLSGTGKTKKTVSRDNQSSEIVQEKFNFYFSEDFC